MQSFKKLQSIKREVIFVHVCDSEPISFTTKKYKSCTMRD